MKANCSEITRICRKIALSANQICSPTNSAIDSFFGPGETTVEYQLRDDSWIMALRPGIVKKRRVLDDALKDSPLEVRDAVGLLVTDHEEAAFIIGMFAGAHLAGASLQTLLGMADEIASRLRAEAPFNHEQKTARAAEEE